MDWTPAQLKAIEQIEAMEAQESQGAGVPNQYGPDDMMMQHVVPKSTNPPVEMPDESAALRQSFSKDVGNAYDSVMQSGPVRAVADGISGAAKGVKDFVVGSGVPQALVMEPRRKLQDGREVQRYSDGKWYPVGTTFEPQKPAALAQVEYINGVKYVLQDGKYIKVK